MAKAELKRIAATIDPTAYLDARSYLAALYDALKAALGSYSYVRFTADLGFGECNALYLVIRGHRPLTDKGARKIIAAIGLTGVGRQYFLKLVAAQNRAKGEVSGRDDAFDDLVELKTRSLPQELDRKQLEFYNHWYNAAILELLSLDDAQDDAAWLGARLMPIVPVGKVENSLALLKRLGHVVFDEAKQRLIPAQSTLSTGAEVYGLAVVRYHQQMIALARDALVDVHPEERDISAVTIAVPASQLGRIKEELQALRARLLELSRANVDADEIVQVNLQMFPLARRDPRSRRHED